MSNHYDDYYPSATDVQDYWKKKEEERLKRVMDHFGVTKRKAQKMIDDFQTMLYACGK